MPAFTNVIVNPTSEGAGHNIANGNGTIVRDGSGNTIVTVPVTALPNSDNEVYYVSGKQAGQPVTIDRMWRHGGTLTSYSFINPCPW